MIKFKKIKPFFFEMVSLVCVIAVFCFCFLNENICKKYNFIQIKIPASFLSIAFIVVVVAIYIGSFSRIMNIGIRSLIDFIFQNTRADVYKFIEVLPFQTSRLTSKHDKGHPLSLDVHYLIQVKKDGKMYTFISSEYLDMKKGERYTITTAASSHIVLDYQIYGESDIVKE